jgi:hypothetical protein
MGLILRKSWTFGFRYLHIKPTMSKSGLSWTLKIGPWSWNTRQRRHRVDLLGPFSWQGTRR